jgi:large subunit ribosomal protein L35
MPKLKTRRAASKRFRRTGSGKIMVKKAMRSHLLQWKPRKKKRQLKGEGVLAKADLARVRRMLPSLFG